MLKKLLIFSTFALMLCAVFPSAITHAQDVQWYNIKEVNDGTKGGGAWIVNKSEGYYIGRAYNGDQLLQISTDLNFKYGLIRSHPFKDNRITYKCGFIKDGIGQLIPDGTHPIERYSSVDIAKYNVCESHKVKIRDRSYIGEGFNCLPGVCVDGTTSTKLADTKCSKKLYYNLFTVGGVPRGYNVAGIQTSNIHYRFTTKDGKWAVVRSDQLGWGYMQKRCIEGYPQGGTKKCLTEEQKKETNCLDQ